MNAVEVRATLDRLRVAGAELRRRPARVRLDALCEVLDRWADPGSKWQAGLCEALPPATGFHPAMVREALAAGLARYSGQALRRLVAAEAVAEHRALAALEQSRQLRVLSFPFEPFQRRAWELRHVMTIYDAWYVALAEALATELITADERLAGAPGVRCPVQVVSSSSP